MSRKAIVSSPYPGKEKDWVIIRVIETTNQ